VNQCRKAESREKEDEIAKKMRVTCPKFSFKTRPLTRALDEIFNLKYSVKFH